MTHYNTDLDVQTPCFLPLRIPWKEKSTVKQGGITFVEFLIPLKAEERMKIFIVRFDVNDVNRLTFLFLLSFAFSYLLMLSVYKSMK